MNISKHEQRVLHALAQGGCVRCYKNDAGRIIEVDCFNRDGWRLAECTLALFKKLKRRGFIMSRDGAPYRITAAGLLAVRPQADNR